MLEAGKERMKGPMNEELAGHKETPPAQVLIHGIDFSSFTALVSFSFFN